MGRTLDQATTKLLAEGKSPTRKTGELDNRGSQFYLTLYWAQALVAQNEDPVLGDYFTSLAQTLTSNQTRIIQEINDVQGQNVDLGGYYYPDTVKVNKAMCPSQTLNTALTNP